MSAAYEIARGGGAVNARTVSEALGCSTQPVMYHFKTMESLRSAVYQMADEAHSEALMQFSGGDPLLDIGLNYIRFAAREKHLFRLLFESDAFCGRSLGDLTDDPALSPVLETLSSAASLPLAQANAVFRTLFLYVHGYASLLAHNAMDFDEAHATEDLENLLSSILETPADDGAPRVPNPGETPEKHGD